MQVVAKEKLVMLLSILNNYYIVQFELKKELKRFRYNLDAHNTCNIKIFCNLIEYSK